MELSCSGYSAPASFILQGSSVPRERRRGQHDERLRARQASEKRGDWIGVAVAALYTDGWGVCWGGGPGSPAFSFAAAVAAAASNGGLLGLDCTAPLAGVFPGRVRLACLVVYSVPGSAPSYTRQRTTQREEEGGGGGVTACRVGIGMHQCGLWRAAGTGAVGATRATSPPLTLLNMAVIKALATATLGFFAAGELPSGATDLAVVAPTLAPTLAATLTMATRCCGGGIAGSGGADIPIHSRASQQH